MAQESKSDEHWGREALRRPLRAQDLDFARRLLSATQFETALQIDTTMKALLADSCDEMDILARMFGQMEPFHQLMITVPQDDLNLVTTRFPGLLLFAKLLEGLAEDIAAGNIRVPRDQ